MDSAAEVVLNDAQTSSAVDLAYRVAGLENAGSYGVGARVAVSEAQAVFSPSMACRVLNVIVAFIALLLLSPLLLAIAILVKLSSPGPVIYRQTRVGIDRRAGGSTWWSGRRTIDYGGKLFTIYKFRTMSAGGDPNAQIWATPHDARVTAAGRVLRRYRLDELPQLFNVLKGDMNIVGPRPEQPKIFISLREEVESYAARQRVLPGITGWAQVNQSYDRSVDDVRGKVRYDLEYISKQSVLRDLRILFLTIPVVVFKRGAW
jgi:lipopolysaccharide/colanic/teichoic acid biosynthesis glycosyltransferase